MEKVCRQTAAVIGAGTCDAATAAKAYKLWRLLAKNGIFVVCGGLGGVMKAVCEGVQSAGGHTVGIHPGLDKGAANEYIHTSIVTGLGPMRNFLVVANADIVISIEGEWGTLSEIALAKKIGKPVIAFRRWSEIAGLAKANTPEAASRIVKKTFSNCKVTTDGSFVGSLEAGLHPGTET